MIKFEENDWVISRELAFIGYKECLNEGQVMVLFFNYSNSSIQTFKL